MPPRRSAPLASGTVGRSACRAGAAPAVAAPAASALSTTIATNSRRRDSHQAPQEPPDRRVVGDRPAPGSGLREASYAVLGARRWRSRCRRRRAATRTGDRRVHRRDQVGRDLGRVAVHVAPGVGRGREQVSHRRPPPSTGPRPGGTPGCRAAAPRACRRPRPGPASRKTTRSAWCSHSGDTVVTTVVRPRRCSATRSAIRASVWASTAEVGSTSTSTGGSGGERAGQHHAAGADRRTVRDHARRAVPANRPGSAS